MGRKNDPILDRKGRKYARWYDASGKKIALSLDTTDYAIALERLPIVKQSGMSWRDYIKSTAGWTETPEVTIPVIATEKELVHLNPPQKFNADKKALKLLLQNALKIGIAHHDSETGEWKINIEGEGDIASQLDSFKKALLLLQLSISQRKARRPVLKI
jgi:hypothetical protein